MGPQQVLLFQIRVDLGVMAMEMYSILLNWTGDTQPNADYCLTKDIHYLSAEEAVGVF